MDAIEQKWNKVVNRRKAYNLAFCSSVLIPEGKYKVGDEKEQSTRRRTVLRCSTIPPNDPECEDAEGKS
ncbi:hypothetical protein H5410_045064 [Solanum commersonii]|uniref:Uncharacterized protein n=1 Tax=Solanum commersonii TaxID=4109 RepID=A0A9J5XBJ8_SOLCO|nr:hypothetical protein H5410_045064 [Solanum commersonii]